MSQDGIAAIAANDILGRDLQDTKLWKGSIVVDEKT